MRQQATSLIIAVALLTAAVGCGDFFLSPGTVVALTLTPVNAAITPSNTEQYTANATLADGTTKDVTSTAAWSSSNTGVATINSAGLATGVALGTTTITAKSGAETATTQLTVSTRVISSIAVSPTNQTLVTGQTQQYTATATFSDDTQGNVTTQVTWTTGNTSIVTISAAGLLTAVGVGTTSVSATSGTISAATNVTVNAF